jgi:hypothetical protein
VSNHESTDMKDKILREYPRLSAEDTFNFSCHAGLACFTHCCADVNIALTPYDALRLRKRLGVGSEEFIERYTLLPPMAPGQKLPMVFLKMDETTKKCQFVGGKGCQVYEDRPWACRMYPVGMASGRTEQKPEGEEFFFILRDRTCDGLDEPHRMTIREWMHNQGTADYDAANDEFKAISLHPFLTHGYALEPEHRQMFFTACYNLDRFRDFVFESTFLQKFEIEPELIEAIREHDDALLRFAYRWLRFALFHEPTIKINPEYEAAKRKVLRAE